MRTAVRGKIKREMLIFVAFLYGVSLFYCFQYFPFSSVFLLVSAFACSTAKKRYILIPVIVIGMAYAFLRFSPDVDQSAIKNKEVKLTGRFVPRTSFTSKGDPFRTFTVDTAADADSGEEIEGLHNEDINMVSDFDADFDRQYEILLKTGKDRTRLNPGGMRSSGLFGSLIGVEAIQEAPFSVSNRFDRERNVLNRYFLSRFKEDSAALVASVTTGETSYLSEGLKEAFNVTGLAHILSISGSHFALFSVVIFGIFSFFIKILPYRALQRLTIYLTPSQAAAIACMPFMIMYLGLSGGNAPAIRSFIMISLFLVGLLLGRKGFWLHSLLFAAFILVMWDPGVILNLSFQLSFLAVLFIGFALEREEEDKEDEEKGNAVVRYLKNSVVLTLAAALGTAPLVAYHFHYFSVVSPLSNLIAAPLIGFVLVPFSLVSSFSFLVSGHYIFAPFVAVSADLSVAIVRLLAKIPFADIKIPAFPPVLCIVFYAGCVLYLVSGKKRELLVVPFIPLLIYAVLNVFEKKELSITFLDVGQGDSEVIELSDKKTIVVDTGRTGKEAAAFLRYRGKRDIDALVLSHTDSDHSGGFQYILQTFTVDEVWDNGRTRYPEGMQAIHRVFERGDLIEGKYCRITVLHPYGGFHTLSGNDDKEVNNSSLVLKVSGKKRSFLLTGDIEEEAELDMSYLRGWLANDVIKMPHHGSRASANDEFLSIVSPSIAVISAGRDNSFGHPHAEVLEKLKGKKIFRTDRDGAVRITERDEGLVTQTYREFMFEKADGLDSEMRNVRRLFSVW